MISSNASLRERLRTQLIENAAEINRLDRRIHETFQLRDQSSAHSDAHSKAADDFHKNYSRLCLPGGPYSDFYARLRAGDPQMMEVALCFLEVRPYFFRSGYHWKAILQKCKHSPKSPEQAERFRLLFERYTIWRAQRVLAAKRGYAITLELWPITKRFYGLFPARIHHGRYDGVVTVGDLYVVLCLALKIEPLAEPQKSNGMVRLPRREITAFEGDHAAYHREYSQWRRTKWTPEDVWATLVANLREAYGVDPSFQIVPSVRLPHRPSGKSI
jgi:hypothetical protein